MIKGLDVFREHFSGFEANYTMIGGVACYLSMQDADIDFRATKDLDIVLSAEALSNEFVQKFWDFVIAGKYEHQEKSTGDKQFYRFSKPGDGDYPVMLELFSRTPDNLQLERDNGLTPIPTDEEVSSLSAILLDDDYYQCIQDGKYVLDGVSILKVEYIIPFKMKAWTDFTERKATGEQIDSKNINKHKNDVLKISQLLSPATRIVVSESIKENMRQFIEAMRNENIDLKSLRLKGLTLDQILELFNTVYDLGSIPAGDPRKN